MSWGWKGREGKLRAINIRLGKVRWQSRFIWGWYGLLSLTILLWKFVSPGTRPVNAVTLSLTFCPLCLLSDWPEVTCQCSHGISYLLSTLFTLGLTRGDLSMQSRYLLPSVHSVYSRTDQRWPVRAALSTHPAAQPTHQPVCPAMTLCPRPVWRDASVQTVYSLRATGASPRSSVAVTMAATISRWEPRLYVCMCGCYYGGNYIEVRT